MENLKKMVIVAKIDGRRVQRTLMADSIYNAERALRKEFFVSEYSQRLTVSSIKCGLTRYEVNGTTLG